MKKTLLIMTALVLGVSIIGVFVAFPPKKSPSSALSARSQEFLQKQKSSDNEVWRDVDTQGSSDTVGKVVKKEACFDYQLPFIPSRIVDNGSCSQTVYLKNPVGQLTIVLSENTAVDVSETSGVALRRSKPDQYSEGEITTTPLVYTTFIAQESGFEQTAFALEGSRLLTVALTSPTNDDLSEEFEKLLLTLNVKE